MYDLDVFSRFKSKPWKPRENESFSMADHLRGYSKADLTKGFAAPSTFQRPPFNFPINEPNLELLDEGSASENQWDEQGILFVNESDDGSTSRISTCSNGDTSGFAASLSVDGVSIDRVSSEVLLKSGKKLKIIPNEDLKELLHASKNPVIIRNSSDFSSEELAVSMKKEFDSLRSFDVFEEVKTSSLSPEQLKSAIKTRWVHTWKGLVKSRLVVQAYNQEVKDLDDVYASTPVVSVLRLFLHVALSKSWCIESLDVSTAFLHADILDDQFVVPPPEFYGNLQKSKAKVIWKLKKSLYGLRNSPRNWQIHFRSTVEEDGFVCLQSDANLFVKFCGVWLLVYVDDILVAGPKDLVKHVIDQLSLKLLIKCTGGLNKSGESIKFLGRTLTRSSSNVIEISMDPSYFEADFAKVNVANSKPTSTTGSSKAMKDSHVDILSKSDHVLFRSIVGRLQWIVPVRPDLAYAVKELARCLSAPTNVDLSALRYVLRFIKGSMKWVFRLEKVEMGKSVSINAYADSNWAGCSKTRKSTSGLVIKIGSNSLEFASRTQSSLALSSGEAELYALGSCVAEALHMSKVLQESKICSETPIIVHTDSSAAKSMASRFGTTRRTRHIELRQLWLQRLVESKQIELRKIDGVDNPADLLTKFVSQQCLSNLRDQISLGLSSNRASLVSTRQGSINSILDPLRPSTFKKSIMASNQPLVDPVYEGTIYRISTRHHESQGFEYLDLTKRINDLLQQHNLSPNRWPVNHSNADLLRQLNALLCQRSKFAEPKFEEFYDSDRVASIAINEDQKMPILPDVLEEHSTPQEFTNWIDHSIDLEKFLEVFGKPVKTLSEIVNFLFYKFKVTSSLDLIFYGGIEEIIKTPDPVLIRKPVEDVELSNFWAYVVIDGSKINSLINQRIIETDGLRTNHWKGIEFCANQQLYTIEVV